MSRFDPTIQAMIDRRVQDIEHGINSGVPKAEAIEIALRRSILNAAAKGEICDRINALFPTKRHLVAVYGSLLRGLGNHGYLRTARFVAHDEVGGLAMFDLGPFPACIGGRYTERVKVEVYEVDDETLRGLDQLEGHPHFYERDEFLTNGQRTVWLYVMSDDRAKHRDFHNNPNTPRVVSGDWRSHLAAKVGGHHA